MSSVSETLPDPKESLSFTVEDWLQTPPAVQEFVLNLLMKVQAQEAENRQLREQLNLHSGNSSRPPSSDQPGHSKAKPSHPPSLNSEKKKKVGGQPGHAGVTRPLQPVTTVKTVKDYKPGQCGQCGAPLSGEDAAPRRHQVTEIPPVVAEVVEHRLHTLKCHHCGEHTTAAWPEGVPTHCFGPRLQALVSLLSGQYHLSKREIESLLADCCQIDLALGSVSALEQRTSQALAAPVEAARAYVRQQAVIHLDETSWPEQTHRGWLWVAATSLVTVYLIAASRGRQVCQNLLGLDCTAIVVSDRWSAYHWLLTCLRQLCWAHLRRDFQAFIDRGGSSQEIGQALLHLSNLMFQWWHAVRDGTLDRPTFQLKMLLLQQWVGALLRQGTTCDHPKTAGTCRDILKREAALWTFVWVSDVEPTNNLAERQGRPGVLWRKVSFGTQSQAGSRFVERIMTVTATLRQQKRNVLDYVTAACDAANRGLSAPSLLPDLPSTSDTP